MILFIFLVVLGYLMGSICSAVIVCKTCSLPDPRSEGSKNPGATNVLRLAGKQYAALVMAADLLKGTIPVVIAVILGAGPVTASFTALAAVVGHMYPAFFELKGGKGVATAIGALLGLQFLVGILVIATWLIVAKVSRYSSLASITSIGLAPLYSLLLIQRLDTFLPIFLMALLVLYKHKENITRLTEGKEPHFKLKKNIIEDLIEEEHKPVHHKTEHSTVPPTTAKIEIETVIVTETMIEKPKIKKVEKSTKITAKTTPKKPEPSEKKTKASRTPVSKKPKDKKPDDGHS